jgi:hypothetical protein
MPNIKNYLRLWLSFTATLLITVATFNLIVDPYGLFRLIDRPGFNDIKPTAGAHGAMTKAYQILRVNPRGLILGNSRSEVGLDPQNPAWPDIVQPVFNLALPGTGTETSLRYLQHAIANSKKRGGAKLEVVVWGIDFMDFLVNASALNPTEKPKKDMRLLVNPDGSSNPYHTLQRVRDYTEATFTLAAFLDSVRTLTNRGNPYSEDLTALGFNPMRDYRKITADEGYAAVFKQKDLANTKSLLRLPKDIFDANGQSSPAFDDLRQIMALCRQNNITLHLVIYPYHTHLLEIIRITGHWPAFESWKREIVHVIGEEATNHEKPFPVWDFSMVNALTSEAIPQAKERDTTMRWYWEAGHFKHELGDAMLNRIFTRTSAVNDFGTLLTSDNVDKQIIDMRAKELTYRQNHAQDIEGLKMIAASVKSQQQKRGQSH